MFLIGCFQGCLNVSEGRLLLEAAKGGDKRATASAIRQKPRIVSSTTFLKKKNALHLAAEAGHVAVLASIVETLCCKLSSSNTTRVSENAQVYVQKLVNTQDSKGRTPLTLACLSGHADCVRYLLANGADRCIADSNGNTALHYSSRNRRFGITFILLNNFSEETESSAVVARFVNALNHAGYTPLHFAVWSRHVATVQLLLHHGADINAHSIRPAGARVGATEGVNGRGESLSLLLADQGPQIGDRSDLDAAAPQASGAPTIFGSTPLHLAAARGSVEICRVLLKTYVDRSLDPVYTDMRSGHFSANLRDRILEADPRIQVNSSGHVPYQVAQRLGHLTLALLLRPSSPLLQLFTSEIEASNREISGSTRTRGPPTLKEIATAALNKNLNKQLLDIKRRQQARRAKEKGVKLLSDGLGGKLGSSPDEDALPGPPPSSSLGPAGTGVGIVGSLDDDDDDDDYEYDDEDEDEDEDDLDVQEEDEEDETTRSRRERGQSSGLDVQRTRVLPEAAPGAFNFREDNDVISAGFSVRPSHPLFVGRSTRTLDSQLVHPRNTHNVASIESAARVTRFSDSNFGSFTDSARPVRRASSLSFTRGPSGHVPGPGPGCFARLSGSNDGDAGNSGPLAGFHPRFSTAAPARQGSFGVGSFGHGDAHPLLSPPVQPIIVAGADVITALGGSSPSTDLLRFHPSPSLGASSLNVSSGARAGVVAPVASNLGPFSSAQVPFRVVEDRLVDVDAEAPGTDTELAQPLRCTVVSRHGSFQLTLASRSSVAHSPNNNGRVHWASTGIANNAAAMSLARRSTSLGIGSSSMSTHGTSSISPRQAARPSSPGTAAPVIVASSSASLVHQLQTTQQRLLPSSHISGRPAAGSVVPSVSSSSPAASRTTEAEEGRSSNVLRPPIPGSVTGAGRLGAGVASASSPRLGGPPGSVPVVPSTFPRASPPHDEASASRRPPLPTASLQRSLSSASLFGGKVTPQPSSSPRAPDVHAGFSMFFGLPGCSDEPFLLDAGLAPAAVSSAAESTSGDGGSGGGKGSNTTTTSTNNNGGTGAPITLSPSYEDVRSISVPVGFAATTSPDVPTTRTIASPRSPVFVSHPHTCDDGDPSLLLGNGRKRAALSPHGSAMRLDASSAFLGGGAGSGSEGDAGNASLARVRIPPELDSWSNVAGLASLPPPSATDGATAGNDDYIGNEMSDDHVIDISFLESTLNLGDFSTGFPGAGRDAPEGQIQEGESKDEQEQAPRSPACSGLARIGSLIGPHEVRLSDIGYNVSQAGVGTTSTSAGGESAAAANKERATQAGGHEGGEGEGEEDEDEEMPFHSLSLTKISDFGDEDEEDECGICLERFAGLQIMSCSHRVCFSCARLLCGARAPSGGGCGGANAQKVCLCPFCRGYVGGFVRLKRRRGGRHFVAVATNQ